MANPYVSINAPAGGYESQLADIKRRMKMAELLAQQGGEDIKVESVNGIPTPISPFQGLAKALQSGMGGYLAGKAAEDEAGLKKVGNEELVKAISGFGKRFKTVDDAAPDVTAVGGEPVQQYTMKTPDSSEMMGEAARVMGLGVPGSEAIGANLFSSVAKRQETEAERERVKLQESAIPKPAGVSDAAWNSAGGIPGSRTELFNKSLETAITPAKRSAEYTRLVDSGYTPGTPEFKAQMDKFNRKDTYIAPVTGPAPGTPQSYIIDGKQVFTTPQDALFRAQKGSTVTAAADAKPKTPAAKTVDQLKNEQLYDVVTPELKTLTKNWGELGSKQNQFFAAIGETKVPFTNIGIPKGSVTGTEYQLAESSLSVIAASYIYSVSGATASPEEVKKTVSTLMPAFGEGEAQKKAKLERIKTMVQAIGVRAKGGFNEAAPLDAEEQEYMRLKALEKVHK